MSEGSWNRRKFLSAALTASAAQSALPQDVGLGARRARGARFEAPYTLAVETPHVKWASPLPGGPIRLLAAPTVSEGRTLVELAQRLSLELTTVSIDPAWDINKWTMAFGSDYGARAERGDLRLIYSYLEEELTSAKPFDAVLLVLPHGWQRLTEPSRQALERRLQDGCGLLLARPFAGALSPLEPLEKAPEADDELEEPRAPGRTESSPWRRLAPHYITRAIPVETFPFEHLAYHPCRARAGAEVLIASDTGRPVLAVAERGAGRVAACAWRGASLSRRRTSIGPTPPGVCATGSTPSNGPAGAGRRNSDCRRAGTSWNGRLAPTGRSRPSKCRVKTASTSSGSSPPSPPSATGSRSACGPLSQPGSSSWMAWDGYWAGPRALPPPP